MKYIVLESQTLKFLSDRDSNKNSITHVAKDCNLTSIYHKFASVCIYTEGNYREYQRPFSHDDGYDLGSQSFS